MGGVRIPIPYQRYRWWHRDVDVGGARMGYVAAVILALAAGFAAGLALLKRSDRWCPGCGCPITLAHCPARYVEAVTAAAEKGRR